MSAGTGWVPPVVAGPETLLRTKLFLPRGRSSLVARARLHELLGAGATARLTLVDAPAGWGKTTLLTDWLSSGEAPRSCWVSLDGADNDPLRFWSYLLAALRTVAPEVGEAALPLLRSSATDIERDFIPVLVNDVAALDAELLLVLDDYHMITNAEIHRCVGVLIERLPATLRLVISTRSDPPLPLARLRVRGELLELRADDLRFTAEESDRLFNDLLQLNLGAEDVGRLQTRTEGWAAGLQLAALTLRDRPDAMAFIARFAGDDRHVVDYLGAEVLDALDPATLTFLLHTSVLNRLCGPLCDAVTGRADSSGLLAEVERTNLFVVPLDHVREWFRYHQLFRELLRHELRRHDPGAEPALHRRAARWYETAGDVPEAIFHAREAGEADMTGRLVAAHWRPYFNQGRLTTVSTWLGGIDPEAVAADAELSAAAVWVAMDRGRLDDVDRALTAAERVRPADAAVRLLRALHRFKSGDAGRAIRLLDDPHLPADPFARTVAGCVRGAALFWSGRTERALAALDPVTDLARSDGNVLGAVYSLGYRALGRAGRGEVAAAEPLVGQAEDLLSREHVGEHFVAMLPALARTRLAELRGDVTVARSAADRAVTLARHGAGRIELAAALVASARMRRWGQPDDAEAVRRLEEGASVLGLCPDPGTVLPDAVAAELRRLAAARTVGAGTPPPRGVARLAEPLTERETAILALLPSPLSQREIAATLYVSPNTLKTHLRAIYQKLGVSGRQEAVARAASRQLI